MAPRKAGGKSTAASSQESPRPSPPPPRLPPSLSARPAELGPAKTGSPAHISAKTQPHARRSAALAAEDALLIPSSRETPSLPPARLPNKLPPRLPPSTRLGVAPSRPAAAALLPVPFAAMGRPRERPYHGSRTSSTSYAKASALVGKTSEQRGNAIRVTRKKARAVGWIDKGGIFVRSEGRKGQIATSTEGFGLRFSPKQSSNEVVVPDQGRATGVD